MKFYLIKNKEESFLMTQEQIDKFYSTKGYLPNICANFYLKTESIESQLNQDKLVINDNL